MSALVEGFYLSIFFERGEQSMHFFLGYHAFFVLSPNGASSQCKIVWIFLRISALVEGFYLSTNLSIFQEGRAVNVNYQEGGAVNAFFVLSLNDKTYFTS